MWLWCFPSAVHISLTLSQILESVIPSPHSGASLSVGLFPPVPAALAVAPPVGPAACQSVTNTLSDWTSFTLNDSVSLQERRPSPSEKPSLALREGYAAAPGAQQREGQPLLRPSPVFFFFFPPSPP